MAPVQIVQGKVPRKSCPLLRPIEENLEIETNWGSRGLLVVIANLSTLNWVYYVLWLPISTFKPWNFQGTAILALYFMYIPTVLVDFENIM